MESIKETLRKYIAENILFSEDGYPYEDGISFLENGIIDSMSVMDLILFSEETFGVVIGDSEITPENIDSIDKLSSFIQAKQSMKA